MSLKKKSSWVSLYYTSQQPRKPIHKKSSAERAAKHIKQGRNYNAAARE
jgi:hypothetical protein